MKTEILFARIKKLIATERRISVKVLECLYEIEKRKAYSVLKYDGLYTYCIKELGFTDSQAYQRIQAMRALNEMPELKSKIETGTLSVSVISKVQTHFKKERAEKKAPATKPTLSEKRDLFSRVENLTSREVDRTLAELRGEKFKKKIELQLDETQEELWERTKNLTAHKTQGNPESILELVLRDWLKRNDPSEISALSGKSSHDTSSAKKPEKTAPTESEPHSPHPIAGSERLLPHQSPKKQSSQKLSPLPQRTVPLSTWVKPSQVRAKFSRKISVSLKREIWDRDQGKCKNCGGKFALEFDHIQPFALQGKNTRENLRLLCRNCNQYRARTQFARSRLYSYGS